MNEDLARLRDELDLGDGSLAAPPAFERVQALFAELELKSLATRLDALTARRA